MEYKIVHISGNLLSQDGDNFVIEAASRNLFQVVEIESEKEVPVKDIVWAVHCGKEKNKYLKETPNGIFPVTIPKAISGIYSYQIVAFQNDKKKKKMEVLSSFNLRGDCKAAVSDIEFKAGDDLKYGSKLDITVEVEGLNGEMLFLEIESPEAKVYKSKPIQCVDGKIKVEINGLRTTSWDGGNAEDDKTFTIKVASQIQYVPDASGNMSVHQFAIKGEKVPEVPMPQGKSLSAVNNNKVDLPSWTTEEVFDVEIVEYKEKLVKGVPENVQEKHSIWTNKHSIGVCQYAEFVAVNARGEELQEGVSWKVTVGDGEEIGLDQIEEIVGSSNTLTGSHIKFAVPKEWGQKTICLVATLDSDPDKRVEGSLYVKDHIAAAFYRINPDIAEDATIVIESEPAGTGNLPLVPLHHHQGVFKENDIYYISGSTPPNYFTPSYVYVDGKNVTEEAVLNSATQYVSDDTSTLKFNRGILSEYTHPGGIQSANGILAVGLERYWQFFPVTTGSDSLVSFFNLKTRQEYLNLRIILDKKYLEKTEDEELYILENRNEKKAQQRWQLKRNNMKAPGTFDKESKNNDLYAYHVNQKILGEPKADKASAVGIVYRKDQKDWLVAVRGNDESIFFYKITQSDDGLHPDIEKAGESLNVDFKKIFDNQTVGHGNKNLKIEKYGDSFLNVGDFQNVNLFTDENEEVYMFGMGNEGDRKYLSHPVFCVTELGPNGAIQYSQIVFFDDELYVTLMDLCSARDSKTTINSSYLRDIKYVDRYQTAFREGNNLFEDDEDDWDFNDSNPWNYVDKDIPNLVEIQRIDSFVETENICRIYRVNTSGDTPSIDAVWIDEDGILQHESYSKDPKNAVIYQCKDGSGPRFNWASCVYCDKKEQKKDKGFRGKMYLYATGQSVIDKNLIETLSFQED